MSILKTDFRKTIKKQMPNKWFSYENKHSHVALEDAIEQGYLFCNILEESIRLNLSQNLLFFISIF